MRDLPFSDPMFRWSDLGISTARTVSWPYSLGLVLSLVLFAVAKAYGATASVNGQPCPIRSAAYLATRTLNVDCAVPFWTCSNADARYAGLVLEVRSACSNDRIFRNDFALVGSMPVAGNARYWAASVTRAPHVPTINVGNCSPAGVTSGIRSTSDGCRVSGGVW